MEAKDYVLALKERGFTQTQIAEGTGIPQPTISKIERGDVTDVMSKSYRALQSFFKKHSRKQPTTA
jgi:transcriptional regulator with XRE-family HTH domain